MRRTEANLLDGAVSREIHACGRRRALARVRAGPEASDHVVVVVVREAASHLAVRIRQSAVEPQPRRLDRPSCEDDELRLFEAAFFRGDATPRHTRCGQVRSAPSRLDPNGERVGEERHRLPARPAIRGQGHRHIARVCRALRPQVHGRAHRLDAALRAMSAERAAFGLRIHEPAPVTRTPRGSFRLEDRVLLRPVRRARDVLRRLDGKTELSRREQEHVLLRSHRGRLHRQRVLDPLVVRNELSVSEWKDVLVVVQRRVGTGVVGEGARHGPRRVGEVVHRRSADAGRLPHVAVLREIARPRRLRSVAWTEAEDSCRGIVRLVLEVTPFLVALREPRSRLEQQDVEPARSKLLRNDGSSAAGADDDHVTHSDRPSFGCRGSP